MVTFIALASNAIWTGLEMEINQNAMLHEADVSIILVENLYVLLFTLELLVRFGAFRRKRLALRDGWFVFDFILLVLMWLETWVLSLSLALFAPDANSSGPFEQAFVAVKQCKTGLFCMESKSLSHGTP